MCCIIVEGYQTILQLKTSPLLRTEPSYQFEGNIISRKVLFL